MAQRRIGSVTKAPIVILFGYDIVLMRPLRKQMSWPDREWLSDFRGTRAIMTPSGSIDHLQSSEISSPQLHLIGEDWAPGLFVETACARSGECLLN
jgi:hypothetical protein